MIFYYPLECLCICFNKCLSSVEVITWIQHVKFTVAYAAIQASEMFPKNGLREDVQRRIFVLRIIFTFSATIGMNE